VTDPDVSSKFFDSRLAQMGPSLAPPALRALGKAGRSSADESRIHRSLDKDAPFHRATERLGVITSRPVLGGLHHQYCRIWFSAHTGPQSRIPWFAAAGDVTDRHSTRPIC